MLSTSARQTQIKQQFSLLNCLESRARFCEFDSKSLSRHWLSSLLAPSPHRCRPRPNVYIPPSPTIDISVAPLLSRKSSRVSSLNVSDREPHVFRCTISRCAFFASGAFVRETAGASTPALSSASKTAVPSECASRRCRSYDHAVARTRLGPGDSSGEATPVILPVRAFMRFESDDRIQTV
jgi:hypothetical protein